MSNIIGLPEVRHLFGELSDEQISIAAKNLGPLKKYLDKLIAQDVSRYFQWLSDAEAIELMVKHKLRSQEEAEKHVANCREAAKSIGYNGKIFVLVKAGFTLKSHAPKFELCYKNWEYLQDWTLENDKKTVHSLVFFVPRWVPDSSRKDVDAQITLLSKFRETHKLSKHYLINYGDASLLAGLILSHCKRTGERIPLNCNWVRTDTVRTDGLRLLLGLFGGYGLGCSFWHDGDGPRRGYVGCFALGVEVLGN